MRYILALIIILTLSTSCATIINGPYSSVSIKSNKGVNYVFQGDTILNKVNEPVTFPIKNSKDPFTISVFTEEQSKTVAILPKTAKVYWLNLFSPYFSGFLVDEITGKKRNYPKKVFIDIDKPGFSYLPHYPIKEGLLNKRNKLGVNPFSLLFAHHPSIEVSYERLHGDILATQFTYGHLLSRDNDYSRNTEGFKLILEEKYFFKNEEKTRWYLGLAAEFLHKTHDADLSFKIEAQQNSFFYFKERTRIEKTFISMTPRIGFQHYLVDRFVLELFAGAGLRYRETDYPDVPENYIETYEDWLFDLKYESNRKDSRMSANFDFNFRISWVF